ncbi:MAG: hypothetical protein ACFHWX_13510 [Bacteroidota bacterium]
MKSLLFIGICIALVLPQKTVAQCNPFFTYDVGTSLTTTNYNPKGKEESSQKMSIADKAVSGSKEVLKTDVTIYDKKGDEVFSNQIDLICEDGVFKMDLSRFAPPGMGQAEGISISYEGDGVTIPSDLSVGKTLPDGDFAMKINSDNPALSGMMGGTTVAITDRKVEAKESITTPAGTFECFKITSNSAVSTKMMGMTRTMETSSIEWISKDVGMVRVESYDKNGKMSSYSELTAFSK